MRPKAVLEIFSELEGERKKGMGYIE